MAIYSVPHLLAEIRDTYERRQRATPTSSSSAASSEVDLLHLDDLGAERQTDWVLEQLYSLVNERWQDQRSILVTTNVPDPYRDGPWPRSAPRSASCAAGARTAPGATTSRPWPCGSSGWPGSSRPASSRTTRDPLTWLRQQVGSRTVSRLIEICDDPLPIMGSDLRMRQGA